MTERGITKRQGYLWTGLFGIVLSAGYFVAAADLPLGTMDEPGARLFPILVDALLLIRSEEHRLNSSHIQKSRMPSSA